MKLLTSQKIKVLLNKLAEAANDKSFQVSSNLVLFGIMNPESIELLPN